MVVSSVCAQEPEVPALKITVTLVQVDAVVTDRHGKHIADLKKDDFRVFQDGVEQKITQFSYMPGLTPAPGAPLAPREKPRAEETRRTVVLLVDDLGLSFSNAAFLREALKEYVKEYVRPGELVAVLRTSGGTGTFQQFTTDPQVLTAAIERLQWNVASRTGLSAQPALGGGEDEGGADAGALRDKTHRSLMGTLAMLRYVTAGLRGMPGRKSIVFFSDGLLFRSVGSGAGGDIRKIVEERFHQVVDSANRADVVISTIDTRGLSFNGLQAKDSTGSIAPHEIRGVVDARTNEIGDSWDGMIQLARNTGGIFYHNTNDLVEATRQAVQDLSGYYVVGYSPSAETFQSENGAWKYHRLSVRVRKSGLQVRTRAGYFGTPDQVRATTDSPDPGYQLVKAVLSPFNSGGIAVRLSALFGNAAETGSYVTAMLHIAGKDLTFSEEADGTHKAQVEVASFIYQDDGTVLDKRASTYSIRAGKNDYENLLRQGFLYRLQHVVQQPGAYQVRAAVRDAASGKIGSASQYLEVPNVEMGGLALSIILVQASANSGAQEAGVADSGGMSLRVFRPGTPIFYGFVVLNPAMKDGATNPDVEIQAAVLRDGRPVWTGPTFSLSGSKPEDPRRVKVAQKLSFGASTPAGDYLLHVVATSHQPGTKRKTRAEQWVNFELRRE